MIFLQFIFLASELEKIEKLKYVKEEENKEIDDKIKKDKDTK